MEVLDEVKLREETGAMSQRGCVGRDYWFGGGEATGAIALPLYARPPGFEESIKRHCRSTHGCSLMTVAGSNGISTKVCYSILGVAVHLPT